MSTTIATDIYLVNRNGTSYKVTMGTIMSTLADTDLLMVNRGSNSYKITAADFRDSVVYPLAVTLTLSSAVAVSGTALSVSTSISGGATPYTNTYQWKSKNPSNVVTSIAGATSASYTPAAGDIGNTLACEVTVTDNVGNVDTQTSSYTNAVTSGAYTITRSTRFNDDDSAYLNRTPSSAGNRRTWTWSGWVKRAGFSSRCGFFATENTKDYFEFWGDSNEELALTLGNSSNQRLTTSASYRDPSAWYHIVIALDTTQATASDRWKLYVNGSQVTEFDTESYPAQHYECEEINNTNAHYIGADYSLSANQYFDGLISDVSFVDGLQLDPTSFAETDATTGQWIPKRYTHVASTNDGTTWSSAGTVSNINTTGTSGPITGLFDGSLDSTGNSSTWMQTNAGNNTTGTYTFPGSGIPFTKCEIAAIKWGGDIKANNVDISSLLSTAWADPSWVDITSSISSPLTSVSAARDSSNSSAIWGIKIDGKVLIDGAGDNSFHLAMDPAESGTNYSGNDAEAVGGSMQNGGTPYITDMSPADAQFQYYSNTGGAARVFNGGVTDTAADMALLNDVNETTVFTFDLRDEGTITSVKVHGSGGEDYGSTGTGDNWVASLLDSSKSAISNTSVTLTSATKTEWTVPVTGTPRYLKFTQTTGTGPLFLLGIEVNGKLLVNHDSIGYDSSGQKNHWHSNNLQIDDGGTPYTAASSASPSGDTGFNSTYPISNLFDGDDSTYASANYTAGDTTDVTVTFSPAVTAGSTLTTKIYQYSTWHSIKVNSGSFVTASAATVDLLSGHGIVAGDSVTSITYRTTSPTSTWGLGNTWYYIKNNGVNLQYAPTGVDLLADVPGAPYDNSLNGGGNYATMNPLKNALSLANGNLDVTAPSPSSTDWNMAMSTMAMSPGEKYYCEVSINNGESTGNAAIVTLGVAKADFSTSLETYIGTTAESWSYQNNSGSGSCIGHNNSFTDYGSNPTYATGDVMGIAVDLSAGTLKYYKNGTDLGTAFSNLPTDTPLTFSCSLYKAASISWNFGARSFSSTPPTGYKALNTFSIPEPTIVDPSDHFDTKLWTGNDSARDITMDNASLSPDLVWIKSRTNTYSHNLYDNVRGATKLLNSNATGYEETFTNGLTSFNSDGFSLGGYVAVNSSTQNFVAWAWDAGSSDTSLSAGDLNSSVYDKRYDWSTYITGSVDSSYPLSNCFGSNIGEGTGNGIRSTNPGTLTLDISSLNLTVGTVTLHPTMYNQPSTFAVNGTTVTNPLSNTSYHGPIDVAVNGAINTIAWSYDSGWGPYCYMRGIEFDGKLLQDTNSTANTPTIDSTYRANTSAGFSIVSFTNGTAPYTVGHGLNAAPSLVIMKSRTVNSTNWPTYHASLGNQSRVYLNLTLDASSGESCWNSTSPTSSVFSVGSSGEHTGDMIAYCWSEVAGYSKFGTYEGNDGSNGFPFVWCGFKPAFLMVKNIDGTGPWVIEDSVRDGENPNTKYLMADQNLDESDASTRSIDFLSNGFRIKGGSGEINSLGDTFIFCAFAETPTKYSNAG